MGAGLGKLSVRFAQGRIPLSERRHAMPQWLGRHKRLLLTAAVMIIGLLAFAACKDDKKEGKTPTPGGSPAAEGPLKIGYLLDFTGALASFGPDEENAIDRKSTRLNS